MDRRHNRIRDVLKGILEDYGATAVSVEQVVADARAEGFPKLDVALPLSGQGIVKVAVTVTHALNIIAMRGGRAAREDGAAADLVEGHKRRSYPGVQVWPSVLEVHGRIGPSMTRLLRSQLAGLPAEERALAMRGAFQWLSATLQHHSAELVLRSAAPSWS